MLLSRPLMVTASVMVATEKYRLGVGTPSAPLAASFETDVTSNVFRSRDRLQGPRS